MQDNNFETENNQLSELQTKCALWVFMSTHNVQSHHGHMLGCCSQQITNIILYKKKHIALHRVHYGRWTLGITAGLSNVSVTVGEWRISFLHWTNWTHLIHIWQRWFWMAMKSSIRPCERDHMDHIIRVLRSYGDMRFLITLYTFHRNIAGIYILLQAITTNICEGHG